MSKFSEWSKDMCYVFCMIETIKYPEIVSVGLTCDVIGMVGYARSAEGQLAIRRGLKDIMEGNVLAGEGALAAELKRRAEKRRNR